MTKLKFCFLLELMIWYVDVAQGGGQGSSFSYFHVKSFGARGNRRTDNTKAFVAACNSVGSVKLSIPEGTYLVGPIKFTGPCRNVSSMTVQVKGYLKATTDLREYEDVWLECGWINGLTLTGGVFDGQGDSAWPHNTCPKKWNCKLLPTVLFCVRISDIFFKNIRGTLSTPVAVTLKCSRGVPCHNVQLRNVHLDHPSGTHPTPACRNVKTIYSDTQIPPSYA